MREKLGSTIQFDNLDDHFNLNHENFYIYYNKYSEHNGRSELHVGDDNGKYLTSNLPLNYYGFSMEPSPDGASIADYGFYPPYAIYNPNHYDKALVSRWQARVVPLNIFSAPLIHAESSCDSHLLAL
ncbi:hypothetical protein [Wolbachia endosymbiont of Glossina morsitans morsitans]|uniref:hypothetical protein n=1 Tax=Wolbachia endosymbiont of Glossina morsitans morsitans TaxID=1150948 RepID=UPI000570EBF1|nr:hypothetical protein [Wolbachia endosymbiont of Glossina morsitans morsitans]